MTSTPLDYISADSSRQKRRSPMLDKMTAYRLFKRSSPKSADADSSRAQSDAIPYSVDDMATHPWATLSCHQKTDGLVWNNER